MTSGVIEPGSAPMPSGDSPYAPYAPYATPQPPVAPPARRKPRPPDPGPGPSLRFVVGGLVAGVAAAILAWQAPLISLGMALLLLVIVVSAVVALALPRRRAALPLALALAFLPWLALRASPWVVTLDLIAALIGVLGALTFASGGRPWESARGYFRRAWQVVESGVLAWPAASRQVIVVARGRGAGRSLVTWIPALAGSALLVGLVTLLLATGDPLFASFVNLGGVLGSLPERLLIACLGAAAFAVLHVLGLRARPAAPASARALVPISVASLVLVGICAVYGLYVLIQASALALGPEYVERRTGLTNAEYARSGFFQLLAVAVITLVLVSLARPVAASAGGRAGTVVRLLALVAVLCTEVMVVVSIARLEFYSEVFGLTMLRLYTSVFAGWLGLVLALAAIALWWSPREWLALSIVVLALLGVFSMNLVNPEAVVARHNLARWQAAGTLDRGYLVGLSTDAVPTIAERLPVNAWDSWCWQVSKASSGLTWNWSRQRAKQAMAGACS